MARPKWRKAYTKIYENDAFCELTESSRYLYQWMFIAGANNRGVFKADPKYIKSRAYYGLSTKRLCRIKDSLKEIEGQGLIKLFEYEGKPYGVIRNFEKYQPPHYKQTDDDDYSDVEPPVDNHPSESVDNSKELLPKRTSGAKKCSTSTTRVQHEYVRGAKVSPESGANFNPDIDKNIYIYNLHSENVDKSVSGNEVLTQEEYDLKRSEGMKLQIKDGVNWIAAWFYNGRLMVHNLSRQQVEWAGSLKVDRRWISRT